MESQKTIKLYVYVDGVNDVPFYGSDAGEYEEFILSNGEQFILSNGFVFNVRNVNEQVEIGNFRFDAKRMGGAPTITFTLMYEDCLDNFWSENVYATFNGEKYFLKQTPTSSLSNEDARYKHDVELISERVALDNVYFFDAVKNSAENNDAVSNSATFAFFGNIVDFKNKLNASLRYADMQTVDGDGVVSGWEVVVDDNITSEEKFISFDNAFFSNAIQESYNTFKIPYYFKGKKIHFGYTDNTIAEDFSYGVDDALLSITKSNANYKVVNRVTGVGSSENLPYYYPNNSPKGDVKAVASSSRITPKILDYETFTNKVKLDGVIKRSNINYENLTVTHNSNQIYSGSSFSASMGAGGISKKFIVTFDTQDVGELSVSFASSVLKYILSGEEKNDANFSIKYSLSLYSSQKKKTVYSSGTIDSIEELLVPIESAETGYKLTIQVNYAAMDKYAGKGGNITYNASFNFGSASGWTYDGQPVELKDLGLAVEGDVQSGDTITQTLERYINTSNVLLPPKYRETYGEQRFYNATNGSYTDDNGEPIVFTNPFVEGHPKEHIITVEDIKPTIKEKRNASNLRIDMFSEFAYDDGDNDETYIDEEDGKTYFKHPYFYGKLRIMDFNLFDHANENQPMTISFTSGDAGACNFEIGATEEYPQMNPVQVDANGNLLRDENGMVLSGIENQQPEVTTFQDRQQDTSKYEVWIALKKEEETYGMLMPQTSLRPKACTSATANDGDTFVILGINLPQSYITAAEQKLEKEIIKYMYENNVEKFKFSIKFSRIYFEENPDVLELLDENSRIYVWYNGVRYTLYVTSMSYYMESDGVLPDITVELDDTLSLTQNALQNAISQVKADVGNALGSIDITALATPYFIRKDQDDEANGVVNFKKGIKFGEGGKVTMYDDNSAKLTIEYLEVTKKATFTSLEIQEKTHVGGQMLISPAAMNCGEVENILDEDGNVTAYRCYMQTKGQDGEEIFNQFAVGDQAICQTFNAWGSKYYWRLVTAVGEDYIDLSVDDCDEESDIPEAGDKIIQLGHRTDKTRQAAQVLSAHGDNAPSFIMYNGIDSYSLVDKNITGIIWNPAKQEPQMYSFGDFFFGDRQLAGNYITFQQKEGDTEKTLSINADVTFGANSTGLSNLSEWQSLESEVGSLGVSVQKVQDQVDGVVENWNGEGTPTSKNEPVKNWITDAEKIAHINDTYINIEEYVDDETTPTAGHAWRWCQCTDNSITDFVEVTDKYDNTLKLHWHPIADSDAVRALKEAAEATKIASEASRLNLLANSAEAIVPAIEGDNHNYLIFPLPIGVSTGDTFTFKAEKADALIGDFTRFTLRLMNTACTEDYSAYNTKVDVGENVTVTLTVTKQGLTYAPAVLLMYAGLIENTAGNSLRTEHFSLVKGTTAMSVWQDYQGDNGLKNLINVKSDETIILTNDYIAELTINSGEQYTFRADNISDSGSHLVGISDFEAIWFTDTFSLVNGSNTYYVLTVKEGVSKQKAYLHIWSSTSGQITLTRPTLVKGTRPMMVWKQNTDYLTNAFKNGSTKISGGLTMTQAVMVEDESGTVRGMLNGSNYAKDSTHGRLIVAAGSEGSTEANMKTATTRIYEDGTVVTNQAEIKTGCKIADIDVSEKGLSFTSKDNGAVSIDEDGLNVINRVIQEQFVSSSIGQCGQSAMQIVVGSNGAACYGSATRNPAGIIISVPETQEAICVHSGMMSGLRPYLNTNDLESGHYLTEFEHTAFATSGTIFLPTGNARKWGQTYKILHYSTGTLRIVAKDGLLREFKGSSGMVDQANNTLVSNVAEVIEIWNGGTNWYFVRHSS